MKIQFNAFSNLYKKHLNNVIAFWDAEMQEKIAKHNRGWNNPYNFHRYLEKSVVRFYKAYLNIPENAVKCCDIGGFWGIYPIVLKELGYNVVMTEALTFYDSSFDKLFNYIKKQGVEIIDIDPFSEKFDEKYCFNYVSVMAVLEHIPNSILFFLNNIRNTLEPQNGGLYIEVPNIGYYFKRVALLKGMSPLPDIKIILESSVPFIGHHHEYTLLELKYIFQYMSLNIRKVEKYNYSIGLTYKSILEHPLAMVICKFFPNTRECIAIYGDNIEN